MTYTDGNLIKIILKMKIENFSFHKIKAFGLEFVKIWPHINLYSSLNGLSGLAFKTQGAMGYIKRGGLHFQLQMMKKKTLLAFLNRIVLDKLLVW